VTKPIATREPATSLLSDHDLYLFNEGTHSQLFRKLGAHPGTLRGEPGTRFAVWAPNAERVSVIGDWNGWDRAAHPLLPRADSGIWEGWVPDVGAGAVYKYHVASRHHGHAADKADPFAFASEVPPRTASIVWEQTHRWGDEAWMSERAARNALDAPMSIYEVHAGSWLRLRDEGDRSLTYRELAPRLGDYVEQLGFTHVELLPIMEHPFYGSWGYQTTGYFAPTARYGTPDDFMGLIDHLHQRGIGVILDWVPSHFPTDEHGPGFFDGTHLYEHADPRKGFHPDWNSYIFNYGRNEVRSFLTSSAMHWLTTYHADGIRVDAVASMLYLDYSRKDGEWIPNEHGGRENLEAIGFLRDLNTEIYREHPDVQTMAEESTAWPMVSRPTYLGGLGFGMKWDMGWMHDTLEYMREDPVHRKFHHNRLTFRSLYAGSENFVLPLSHDEVVHGKGSLVGKMPGDEWQRMANLRLLLGAMYAQPGKKLLFMGGETGQLKEWDHDAGLDWDLLELPLHTGVRRWVRDLNRAYAETPALHELDTDPAGLEWVDANDNERSLVSFLRWSRDLESCVLVVCNFTPVPRPDLLIGVPRSGRWRELLNSDADAYGGSGVGNLGSVEALPVTMHGRPHALPVTVPPLACIMLAAEIPADAAP